MNSYYVGNFHPADFNNHPFTQGIAQGYYESLLAICACGHKIRVWVSSTGAVHCEVLSV